MIKQREENDLCVSYTGGYGRFASQQQRFYSVFLVAQHDKAARGVRLHRQQAVRLPCSWLQETLQKHQRDQVPREERTQEGRQVRVSLINVLASKQTNKQTKTHQKAQFPIGLNDVCWICVIFIEQDIQSLLLANCVFPSHSTLVWSPHNRDDLKWSGCGVAAHLDGVTIRVCVLKTTHAHTTVLLLCHVSSSVKNKQKQRISFVQGAQTVQMLVR